ncbi:hypothetical protein Q5O89_12925 [Peribacillus frigoritolerans]|nr:hypothetical protein [Peribacillus frigoritolerans]
MTKNIEDYPMILTAVHLSEILMVSKPTAYELMEQKSFPLIKLGRSKRVLRDKFQLADAATSEQLIKPEVRSGHINELLTSLT